MVPVAGGDGSDGVPGGQAVSDQEKIRRGVEIDSRIAKNPYRASAGPDCCSAGASGPAVQRGRGSQLKGWMGRAPYPHADAAFRPIGRPVSADGGMPENCVDMGLFVPSDAMHNYVTRLAVRPAASASPGGGAYHEFRTL